MRCVKSHSVARFAADLQLCVCSVQYVETQASNMDALPVSVHCSYHGNNRAFIPVNRRVIQEPVIGTSDKLAKFNLALRCAFFTLVFCAVRIFRLVLLVYYGHENHLPMREAHTVPRACHDFRE